jgi:hypothetical protein
MCDGVTSAAGSDARKSDDGDPVASPRSDETPERALDAPERGQRAVRGVRAGAGSRL